MGLICLCILTFYLYVTSVHKTYNMGSRRSCQTRLYKGQKRSRVITILLPDLKSCGFDLPLFLYYYEKRKFELGKASDDSAIESYVLFPFSQNRCLVEVQIMDINGTDFNIEMVKTLLLQSRNVPDIATYQMGFKNEESEEIIETVDSQIITDFRDYLLNSNFTIVFLKTVSGKSR